ncbi:OPT/YSL family transporter [Variovorax sp. YR216]|uniref:OPT/YSL family transporter n=1 Tax=Variovorax sp. YR216 TaxID=1882828 RepID=UPI000899FE75|nr:OPT/YSL family transporter [Variovorax sp. YR216]SEB09421.1 Uncharacterized membrane protein, oligopeptide transporter (OPT) family [Variovorax sp. YR216]
MDRTTPLRWRWLPVEGSWRYHLLLAVAGMFVLGPLAGVTAAYMNFSLGFFVGGQVLAGLLGSAVTAGYGAAGRHGANYIQTAAASVASMSGLGVLLQAMAWMGLPQPPAWQMVLYLTCVGMFGVGVGMLYTPVLVDRMRLTFPSGLAVANILRALTDPDLLRRSVKQLGGGAAVGLASGLATSRLPLLGAIELSASTFGAGLVIGARIGIPAVVGGLIGVALKPHFVGIGWLQPGDPPRKIMFLIALGTIMGAALIDLGLIFARALPRARREAAAREPTPAVEDWKRVNIVRLVLWVLFWAIATVVSGHLLLGQPVFYLAVAVALVFLFALVNGISVGISDSNPISSAFVVTVIILAALGLRDPGVGLMAGAVLLVATSVACDMQQDRSTGWRLGTPRVLQFRYQVLGILMGATMAVVFARLFMAAYPVLLQDQTVMKADQQPAEWASAMTYKLVGVLRGLTDEMPYQRTAIAIGVAAGAVIEVLRKRLRPRSFWLDAIVLPSPYALSFGGFVNLPTSLWLGAGGVAGSLLDARNSRRKDVPPDMGIASLFGGGLIAGDALAAVGIGVASLLAALV